MFNQIFICFCPSYNNTNQRFVNKNLEKSLGRKARLKSKLHSLPQADRNWKPINAFATRLGRQIGTAHSICN